MAWVLWACFLLSGASALMLELLWMRSAALVLGGTAATAAAVLGCYFTGLGLGATAGARPPSRPVTRYARLELGVAVGGLWSLLVFAIAATERVAATLAVLGTAGRLATIALALLPATTCLGATLPALGGALAGRGGAGRRGGLLYALNTAGAALGAALAGFGLPAWIGVRASYAAAIAGSAAAGLLALGVGDGPRAGEPGATSDATRHRRLHLAAAISGALALALEVLWIRLFAQVLHNSVYSFTAVALVFLLAIAGGAALAALLVRRRPPEPVAGAALALAGAATIVGYWTFIAATGGLAYMGMRSGLAEYLVRIVAVAAVTAGPAALASAAALPALWAAWGDGDAAPPLGRLSAASAFGSALGAVGAGFVAVPLLGVRAALLVIAVAYLLLGDSLLAAGAPRTLARVALLAAVVANPLHASIVSLRPEGETLRAILEGPSGIVSVVDTGSDLQLRLDNYYALGGTAAATNQRRQGLVPLLLHPAPRRVAFIGLATGTTASAGPALGVERTVVVELVGEVAEAARLYFATWNGQLLERPDVELVVDDGRRWLATTRERFDVVVSDLFIPWHAGAGSLYAREMYESAARHLSSGGLFCQWLPLYQLTREEFDVIVRTFASVFPDTRLWRDDFYADRPVVALVGRLAPEPVDLARVATRVEGLPAWGRDPLLASSRGLAMLYVGDMHAMDDLFARGPLNTDDRPLIEFLAPHLTRMSVTGDKDWFTGEALGRFYDAVEARGGDDPFAGASGAGDARRAGTALFRYALAASRHDDAASGRWEAEVRRLVPDVIAAAETGDDAGTALAGLRAAQDDVRRQIETMERRLREITGESR